MGSTPVAGGGRRGQNRVGIWLGPECEQTRGKRRKHVQLRVDRMYTCVRSCRDGITWRMAIHKTFPSNLASVMTVSLSRRKRFRPPLVADRSFHGTHRGRQRGGQGGRSPGRGPATGAGGWGCGRGARRNPPRQRRPPPPQDLSEPQSPRNRSLTLGRRK